MTSVVVILMRSCKSEAMSHLTGAFCFKHGFIVQNTCFDDEGTRKVFLPQTVFCHKRTVGLQKGPMAHCSMMQEVPCTWSTCYNCCTWSTWCTWCTCCTWFTCAPGALAAPGPHAAPGSPVAPGPPVTPAAPCALAERCRPDVSWGTGGRCSPAWGRSGAS